MGEVLPLGERRQLVGADLIVTGGPAVE